MTRVSESFPHYRLHCFLSHSVRYPPSTYNFTEISSINKMDNSASHPPGDKKPSRWRTMKTILSVHRNSKLDSCLTSRSVIISVMKATYRLPSLLRHAPQARARYNHISTRIPVFLTTSFSLQTRPRQCPNTANPSQRRGPSRVCVADPSLVPEP